LTVVYGVRRVNGNLVFADIALPDIDTVYIVEAICEGPVHGIFNVYVDDDSLICVDKPDSDIRDYVNGSGDKDIACVGRTDEGEVLSGIGIVGTVPLTYLTENDMSESLYWKHPITGTPGISENPFYDVIRLPGRYKYDSDRPTFTAGSTGVTHDKGFKFLGPTDIKTEFKAGKAAQSASSMMMTQAHGDGFKIQKDYFGASLSGDYWGETHQLLDTAYTVSTVFLTADQNTVPDMEYVIKGKILDCYNYDGSYHHDRDPSSAHGTEGHHHFILGQTVNIKETDGDTPLAAGVVITDKWYYTAGDEYGGTRFRWNLSENQENALNSAGAFYMETIGVSPVQKWHMVTHDYAVPELTVLVTLAQDITADPLTTGDADLAVNVGGSADTAATQAAWALPPTLTARSASPVVNGSAVISCAKVTSTVNSGTA
jgi:hypothetical protein